MADSGDDFRESLADTSLFNIGAYFADAHPELVDEVLAESERIERMGLAAYARTTGIGEQEAFQTLITGLAIRYHRAISG